MGFILLRDPVELAIRARSHRPSREPIEREDSEAGKRRDASRNRPQGGAAAAREVQLAQAGESEGELGKRRGEDHAVGEAQASAGALASLCSSLHYGG